MNSKALTWLVRGAAALAAMGGGLTLAQADDKAPAAPVHYAGLINDYTASAAVVKNGPYEIRGKWALDLDPRHGSAKFTAELNMETSDYGISEVVTDSQGGTEPLVNKDDPSTRGAHTHHIVMTDGVVSTNWASCPTLSPAATDGFVVTGPAYITANGSPALFGNPSTLTVCVLGGSNVTFSNVTLTFSAPANTHFGMFAIHGVVAGCTSPWGLESKDCKVQEQD